MTELLHHTQFIRLHINKTGLFNHIYKWFYESFNGISTAAVLAVTSEAN